MGTTDDGGVGPHGAPLGPEGPTLHEQASGGPGGPQLHAEGPRKGGVSKRDKRLRLLAIGLGVAPILGFVALRMTVIAYRIPSGAMAPTILIGDHIMARRGASEPPARGEVIVFEFPENRAQDFIKRTIAHPGDTLEALDGRPIINGWAVPHCKVGTYHYEGRSTTLYLEFLGDRSYGTIFENEPLDTTCKETSDCGAAQVCRAGLCGTVLQGPWHVPAGQVFVMGDNRNNSHDSRSWRNGMGGGVPFDHLHAHGGWIWLGASGGGDRFNRTISGPPVLPRSEAGLAGAMQKCLSERPPPEKTTPPPPK